MFASSQFGVQIRPGTEATVSDFGAGEGRHSERARQATEAVLLRDGRPGAWLVLLGAAAAFVLVQAALLRFA